MSVAGCAWLVAWLLLSFPLSLAATRFFVWRGELARTASLSLAMRVGAYCALMGMTAGCFLYLSDAVSGEPAAILEGRQPGYYVAIMRVFGPRAGAGVLSILFCAMTIALVRLMLATNGRPRGGFGGPIPGALKWLAVGVGLIGVPGLFVAALNAFDGSWQSVGDDGLWVVAWVCAAAFTYGFGLVANQNQGESKPSWASLRRLLGDNRSGSGDAERSHNVSARPH